MKEYVLPTNLPESLFSRLIKILASGAPLYLGVWAAIKMFSTIPGSDDPAMAVLGGLFVLAIFGGIGLILLGLVFSRRSKKIDQKRYAIQGYLCENNRNGELYISILLISVALIIVAMGLLKGLPIIVVSLIFWIPGLLLLRSFILLHRNKKVIGATRLHLDPVMPVVGNTLNGYFVLDCQPAAPVAITLFCEKAYWYEDEDEGSSRKSFSTLFKEAVVLDDVSADSSTDTSGYIAKFQIEIPDHLPHSQLNNNGELIIWTIRASGDVLLEKQKNNQVKKQRFHRNWTIPVIGADQQIQESGILDLDSELA